MSRTGPVVVVSPGADFLSGISYYGANLARALCEHSDTSGAILLLRRLCPAAIYPGKDRIGSHPHSVLGLDAIPTFNGIDWFWGLTLPRAIRWLGQLKPSALVLQWWTGTASHTYLALAIYARRHRIPLIVEFHETLDVSEAALPIVPQYVKWMMSRILRHASGIVVHSSPDILAVHDMFPASQTLPVVVAHHAPTHHNATPSHESPSSIATQRSMDDPLRLTFFGVMRPYKGLDVLADAYEKLLAAGENLHLTIAGEVWPECAALVERFQALPDERATVRLGHLPDNDLADLVSQTDIIVLPYLRSSASGPLSVAMAAGLPVVTSNLPTLAEVAAPYSGAVLSPPGDVDGLVDAIIQARSLVGERHVSPHNWKDTVAAFHELLANTPGGK